MVNKHFRLNRHMEPLGRRMIKEEVEAYCNALV